MGKVFLFGPLILTNYWGFRTNILNISLDRNFPYIHDIVMEIRSVSPCTLNGSAVHLNVRTDRSCYYHVIKIFLVDI